MVKIKKYQRKREVKKIKKALRRRRLAILPPTPSRLWYKMKSPRINKNENWKEAEREGEICMNPHTPI